MWKTMTTKEKATEYLGAVLAGMVPRGVQIACDESDVGLAFSVIPAVVQDYKILIGFKGKNSNLLRALMKLWKNENAPNLSIHVFVPNPNMIITAKE